MTKGGHSDHWLKHLARAVTSLTIYHVSHHLLLSHGQYTLLDGACQPVRFRSRPAGAALRDLRSISPDPAGYRVFLPSTGSQATENRIRPAKTCLSMSEVRGQRSEGSPLTPTLSRKGRGGREPHPSPLLGGEGATSPQPSPGRRGSYLTPTLSWEERELPHPSPLLGGEGATSPQPSPRRRGSTWN